MVILRRLLGESNVEGGEHGADDEWIDGERKGDDGDDGDDGEDDDVITDGGDEDRSQLSRAFLLLMPLPSFPKFTSLIK